MPNPFKILVEIGTAQQILTRPRAEIAGWIGPATEFNTENSGNTRDGDMQPPRIVWAMGANPAARLISDNILPRSVSGIAFAAPNGMSEVDEMSAALRVYEARNRAADRSIALIPIVFSDIAAFDARWPAISQTNRITALAFDETALVASLGSSSVDGRHAAPLLHARALTVIQARKLGVPAFIKPLRHSHQDLAQIKRDAIGDGFDGLIAPPDLLDGLSSV